VLFLRNINKKSILITIIISTLIFNFMILKVNKPISNQLNNSYSEIYAKSSEHLINEINQIKKVYKKSKIQNKKWKLEIESIGLNANISEGTDVKTLNKNIGHFENTKKAGGNIGLAAHNRGYKVNYFQNIKKLKLGDKIKYFYNGRDFTYKVYKNYIILDTDWNVLDENNKQEITLITCVENQPYLRRCVKGILIN